MFDLFDDDEDDLESEDAELVGSAQVFCPYCGAPNDWAVDIAGGGVQEYVEDCHVCCQPCSVRVEFVDGQPSVWVQPLDGE